MFVASATALVVAVVIAIDTVNLFAEPAKYRRKEVEHSYFADLKAMNKDKGKSTVGRQWQTIPPAQAKRFPSIQASTLKGDSVSLPQQLLAQPAGSAVRATVLLLGFRDSATTMKQDWLRRLSVELDKQPEVVENGIQPSVQLVEMNVVDNLPPLLGHLLESSIRKRLAAEIPAERHGTFLLHVATSRKDKAAVKEFAAQLDCSNIMTGYVIVIDGEGRIRWICAGEPTDEDVGLALHSIRLLQLQ